jgi:hypothetical protein
MPDKLRDSSLKVDDLLGVLSKEFRVRVLNCSSSGCLVESSSRMEVGTVGTLRVILDGNELIEDVQVVRCQQIEGAGSMYHVGAQFLWTDSPDRRSLRRAMRRRTVHDDETTKGTKPLM